MSETQEGLSSGSPARAKRPTTSRDDVAEPGGGPAEERSEALGDGEEQRLLPPAEEERTRGARGTHLRYLGGGDSPAQSRCVHQRRTRVRHPGQ